MKADGKLDKYGRVNENTPENWKKDYKDLDEQPAPPIPESKLVAPEPQLPKEKSLIEEVEVDIDVEDKSEKKEKKDKKEKKEKKR